MLWKTSSIKDRTIAASDGQLGTVTDLLFDDSSWQVRWLVVDTGSWLSSRRVLLPISALGHLAPSDKEFPVRLTMQQVKDSPDIDTERPVSRQMEASVYGHYGWAPYWGGGLFVGGYAYGVAARTSLSPSSRRDAAIADAQREKDDLHLRSVAVVGDYHIHSTDGDIGHIEDFLVEDADWSIRYLIVDTKNWWPGKKVLISPQSVSDVLWTEGRVNLDIDRKTIKDSPTYDPATKVDRAYETHFRDHYDAARPSSQL